MPARKSGRQRRSEALAKKLGNKNPKAPWLERTDVACARCSDFAGGGLLCGVCRDEMLGELYATVVRGGTRKERAVEKGQTE